MTDQIMSPDAYMFETTYGNIFCDFFQIFSFWRTRHGRVFCITFIPADSLGRRINICLASFIIDVIVRTKRFLVTHVHCTMVVPRVVVTSASLNATSALSASGILTNFIMAVACVVMTRFDM